MKKSSVGLGLGLIVGGGVGLILFATKFQNWKHGFSK